MPTDAEHLAQAHHNEAFAGACDAATYSDWVAVGLFYAGLHYIDALLAVSPGYHPGKHSVRDNAVNISKDLKPVATDYFVLKNASLNARYNPPYRPTPAQLHNFRTVNLERIRNAVRAAGLPV